MSTLNFDTFLRPWRRKNCHGFFLQWNFKDFTFAEVSSIVWKRGTSCARQYDISWLIGHRHLVEEFWIKRCPYLWFPWLWQLELSFSTVGILVLCSVMPQFLWGTIWYQTQFLRLRKEYNTKHPLKKYEQSVNLNKVC